MAVGPLTDLRNPLQISLRALEEKYPQYHIVLWASDGGSPELMPGTRWFRRDSELISTNNRGFWGFSNGTHHYEYYLIIEGIFTYKNNKMNSSNYSTFVASTAGFDFEKKECIMKTIPEFSNSWMSRLSPDMCLKDLTLPGTRSSSASTYWINDAANLNIEPEIHDKRLKLKLLGMHKFHKDSVRAQLNSGIRLLDLRCDEERRLRHGPIVLDKQLDDVLDHVKEFLTVNTKEAVMIMLSFSSASVEYDDSKPWSEGYSIKNDEVPKNFNRELKRDMIKDDFLYTGKEWPKLSDVRGKAVIFREWDVESDQDRWGLDCRLPKWEAVRCSGSSTKACDLAAKRWKELKRDFSSRDSLISIVLGACLRHDPTDEESWVLPLETAPLLQKKAEEYVKKQKTKLKHLWVYGDDMKEETSMAIAKLNFWGSGDQKPSRPESAPA
ncbi:hypothetical protein CORC01_07456 [Colletotrichum orchidophilum]|uniref:Phosphatidylinositol-specific phospholipase C X domain-containing protein n=1 Tax=Colletotrichum orchidophilum TaxID=1209926 RepID=A0A1G4B7E2_9PEZI|nr:uncharacterized protein CORC01_07456 [Colletotrichum orchidophilum]OHE97202.1 hypothetical protein CORC01_07456 [Colletotrichum orchidophilum]